MRFLFWLAASLAACGLSAQFYSSAAAGYQRSEHSLATAAAGSYLVHGGAAWDPTGTDLYYWDVAGGGVRRFDTTAGTPAAATLFPVPPGPGGFTYVDALAFDPFTPTDLYIGESGNMVLHKVRRSGVDTLDGAFGTGGVQTSAALPVYVFDIKFDPYGRLFAIGSNSFGTPKYSGIYVVNKSTLALTQVVDLLTTGGTDISGPIAFDSTGDLYLGVPPTTPGDPGRILRWSKAKLDAAVASGGTAKLVAADAATEIDWLDHFPAPHSMEFRKESGADVLYFSDSSGHLYRSVLSTRAYTTFAMAATAPAGSVNFPSVMAIESATAPFRPYSGDTTRLAVVMGTRDGSYNQTAHSICVFKTAASPAGIASLAVSGLPATLANGTPFGAMVELRDAGNALMTTTNASVQVEIFSGLGTLSGRTLTIASAGVAVFDDLSLSGASGSVVLRFSVVGGSTTANTGALAVAATGGSANANSDSDDSSGCTTGKAGLGALVALLALALLGRVRRRRA
ncbi:MAG: hypothetical protein IT463_06825 [Planctomycetes bacterium]|nr:hypothetical protein [Planctomycetota bacterium]